MKKFGNRNIHILISINTAEMRFHISDMLYVIQL